jgi:Mrp family chromosome partitioning ATPase/capsular polysaccharide biosynthesis protein
MEPITSKHDQAQGGLTLYDAVALLRRRRWIVIVCLLLVPLSALGFSLLQRAQFQGNAEVLLSQQSLANSLTGVPDPANNAANGDRVAQTQAKLATVPTIAARTLKALSLSDRSPTDLLDKTEVTTEQNSDILTFKVTDPNRALAAALANEYAKQYTRYRAQIDTAAVNNALDEVSARIKSLEAGGERSTSLHGTLVDKQQQLRTLEALQTSNAAVVRREDHAEQVKPTPIRNAVLGVVLGALLGIGLAFARDAFDTRVRSAEQLSEVLGLPLLARIPGQQSRTDDPVMMSNPHGAAGEVYRVLRSNLEFSMLGREIRSLLVTSAIEDEGKSTVVSNLALALARGGRRVVLVDLDLRRPTVETLFHLKGLAGATNVAIGNSTLDEACVNIALKSGAPAAGSNDTGTGGGQGSLDILPCGVIPPDPGEFVGTDALGKILDQLRERYDIVLIDAPPMLRVGDPLTLARRVDALFVVARIGVITSAMAGELARALKSAPTVTLGVVATGVGDETAYAYGYGDYTSVPEQVLTSSHS